jgi:hypothetical protein
MTVLRRIAIGVSAVSIPLLAASALAAPSSASVRPQVSTPTGATFAGSAASPTITITGTGFGLRPTGGVSPSKIAGCQNHGTGADFTGGALWTVDAGQPNWAAGARTATSGNCVGDVIKSWSNTKIVFTYGSQYNSNGWVLHDNDVVVFSVVGAPVIAQVPAGF